MVCEDFNEILYRFEKKGCLIQEKGRMKVFWKVLEDCNLVDVGFFWELVHVVEGKFTNNKYSRTFR